MDGPPVVQALDPVAPDPEIELRRLSLEDRIVLSGSLVMGSTPMLLRVLEALGPPARRPVVLDTGGLVLIDSWGIHAISELQRRLIEGGWDASVRCGDGPAHDVFAVMGSRRVTEAAVSAFSSDVATRAPWPRSPRTGLAAAVVSFGRRPVLSR